MSLDTLAAGVPWDDFETFPQYLDAVERRGTALNYGCYVGHTAVRLYVMGDDGLRARRPPTTSSTRMQAGRRRGDGRRAPSASRPARRRPTTATSGRPVPSRVADLDELGALLEPLRDADKGVVALLPGESVQHDEVFDLQREVGRPAHVDRAAHDQGLPVAREGHRREHDAARADGVEVWPQVSCRPLVFQMNLARAVHVQHAPVVRGADGHDPIEERIAALPRPGVAGEGVGRASGGGARCRPNWDSLVGRGVAARTPSSSAASVVDLAAERGGTPLDVMLDLSLDENLETRFWSRARQQRPRRRSPGCCPQDGVLLGLADSGAHVSQLCDACFATDLLGNWVRDREVMPLERAIHKLTGEPAGVFGLDRPRHGRGRARPPTSSCSTPTRSPRARCAASATSRPTASGSSPTRRWA